MKRILTALIATAALLWAFSGVPATAAPQATQDIVLKPGWNAVYLLVQPDPRDPESVFAGLPVESVWTWLGGNSTVEYIQNPSEGLWNTPGWHHWFSAAENAYLDNLYAIFDNWPYLIKVTGDQNVLWQVQGGVTVGSVTWVADSFNLVGFDVDRQDPPTFTEFFSSSPAHAGQPVYRLNDTGVWELIEDPDNTTIVPGVAYWVYCSGPSTYQDPLEVNLPLVDGLNYGAETVELTISVRNMSPLADTTVTFTLLDPSVAMEYRRYNSTTGYYEWHPLDPSYSMSLDASRWAIVKLAVRRSRMAAGASESILEIRDTRGTRVLVPVYVEKIGD
ncbi:MAG: hypothetical protein ACLFOY_15110 [Desulfatibacillaceae bacterium]